MQYPAAWLKGASLGEAIASELRLQIINEKIKPGEVLSENRIAADFNASRSPVREALKVLSGEGLIRPERMGAVVVGLSLEDVKELYDVRYLIESFALQRLAGTGQEEMILRLEQLIDRMKLAVKHNNLIEFAQQDFAFHETIVTEAGHTRILHLWNSIRHIVMTVILITTQQVFTLGEEHMNWVAEKHRTLAEALRSGNPDTLHRVVQAYFEDSGETLTRSLS